MIGSLTVNAVGESLPLVPTADGVQEPQNRRVEIEAVGRGVRTSRNQLQQTASAPR